MPSGPSGPPLGFQSVSLTMMMDLVKRPILKKKIDDVWTMVFDANKRRLLGIVASKNFDDWPLPSITSDHPKGRWFKVAEPGKITEVLIEEDFEEDMRILAEYDEEQRRCQETEAETEVDTDEEPEYMSQAQAASQVSRLDRRIHDLGRDISELRDERSRLLGVRQRQVNTFGK